MILEFIHYVAHTKKAVLSQRWPRNAPTKV